MTIAEIAEIMSVSYSKALEEVRALYPHRVKRGRVPANFTSDESAKIMLNIKSKNYGSTDEGMTISELSDFVGSDYHTVARWVRNIKDDTSCNMQVVERIRAKKGSPKNPARYKLDEVLFIAEKGLGSPISDLLKSNAEQTQSFHYVQNESNQIIQKPYYDIEKTLAETAEIMRNVAIMTQNHEMRLQRVEQAIEKDKAVISGLIADVPEKSTRSMLNQLIRAAAQRDDRGYRELYRELYKEYLYTYSKNIRQSADNRGISVLDYAEQTGEIDNLFALAVKLYAVGGAK